MTDRNTVITCTRAPKGGSGFGKPDNGTVYRVFDRTDWSAEREWPETDCPADWPWAPRPVFYKSERTAVMTSTGGYLR